jgi:hypothetical protein
MNDSAEKNNDSDDNDENKNDGGINLDDLLKQAKELNNV